MTLTLPRAGMTGGRSADIRIEAPKTGAAIQQLGQVVQQVGNEVERRRLDSAASRLDVDMTRDINALRLEFEEYGDPDRIDAEWAPRVQALKQQYLTGQTDTGRPRVDPKLAERFSTQFDALTDRHAFALGQKALAIQQSQQVANFIEQRHLTVSQGAMMDPDTRNTMYASLDAKIDEQVAAGITSPAAAAEEKLAFRAETERAAARLLIDSDPQLFRDLYDDGEFNNIPAEQRASLYATAGSKIAADAARAQAEADRLAKERQVEIGNELTEATRIAGQGRVYANEAAMLTDDAFMAHPAAEGWAQQVLLRDTMPDFARLTPTEQAERIAAEAARPVPNAEQLKILDAMRAAHDMAKSGWNTDPIQHAQDIGLGQPPALPDPMTAAPDDLIMSLDQRNRWAASLVEAGYLDEPVLFTKEERAAYTKAADPSQTPEVRARLAASFAAATGESALELAEEIGGDPLFAYVGGLMAFTGNEDLARQIFEGQRAMDNEDVPLPPRSQRRQEFFVELSGLFDPEFEAGQLDQVITAADALYTFRARGKDERSDGKLSPTLYLQAVHNVLGGTGNYGNNNAVGGIMKFRDLPTFVPPDIRHKDITQASGRISRMLRLSDEYGRANLDSLFERISFSGNTPSFGGEPMNLQTWYATKLVSLGGDRYMFHYDHPKDGPLTAEGADGADYVLDLRKLLQEFAATPEPDR
ncbi:hypothetical protein ACVDG3_18310 [Meridianimarinicoccus sp. RP-17]|uniref:hypothetical protein n=1 Tax=Meridianimarinicoccus zhengii TaxID=2056810 RepID=UPI000DADA3FE|nr:hypothetical protein [Phycocomes zhengii]